MALPIPAKTYSYNVNNAVLASGTVQDTYRSLVWNLKTALVGGGWLPKASSNSSSVALYPTDLWVTPANVVASYNTWGRSWIVLSHPLGICDICIDMNGGPNNPLLWTFSVSRQGYVTTGLSTSSHPATIAGDEQTFAFQYPFAWGNSNQNFVWHYIKSTDNQSHKWFLCTVDVNPMAVIIDVPQNAPSGWNGTLAQQPFAMYYGSTTNNSNVFTTGAYSGATFVTCMGSGSGAGASLYLAGESYNGNLLTNGLTTPNDVTGEYPLVATSYVQTGTPGFRGIVGDPVDTWFGVSTISTGATYPADNSRQFVQFGTLAVPWNGSVPLTR